MRRLLLYGLPLRKTLFFLSLLAVPGCTGVTLQTYPASDIEIASAYESFEQYQEISEGICGCCLDAEIDAELTISGWFNDHTGKFSGYLQAMKPGYIRFVTLNPLDQPLFIFVTNGKMFKGINVFAEKAYSGSVESETYRKIAPSGFDPEFTYYWLTGRLQPGEIQIRKIMRAGQQDVFWLQIQHNNTFTSDSMVLFDTAERVVLRHILRDEKGKHIIDIKYMDYEPLAHPVKVSSKEEYAGTYMIEAAKNVCSVPGRITVASHGGKETIELKLHSFLQDAAFQAEDFQVNIPDNFEQLLVK